MYDCSLLSSVVIVKLFDYHDLVISGYYPLVLVMVLLFLSVFYLLVSIRRLTKANKHYENAFVQMKLNGERNALAIEGSGDGIWDWDITSDSMYFSQQYKKLLGYSDDELSNTYEDFLALLHPEDKNKFLDAVNNHFKKGDIYDVELRLKNKTGAYVWFRVKGQAVFENEKAMRMSGSLSDISALKNVLAQLYQNERRFRQIADSIPNLLWMSDVLGSRYYFNQPWCLYTGQNNDQDMIENWIDCIHPEDKDSFFSNYISAIGAKKSFNLWYRLKNQQGNYRWFLDVGNPRFSDENECIGYIGSCTDVTDQRQAYSILENKQHFVQAIMNAMPEPVFVLDDRHQLREGNQAFWRLFSSDYNIKSSLKDSSQTLTPMATHYLNGISFDGMNNHADAKEEDIQTSSGDQLTILTTKSPLVLLDGSAGLVGVIHDITARKQFEREIQQHRDILQAQVEVQTERIRADSQRNVLLRKISESANLSYDIESVITLALNAFCHHAGFAVGHCLLFNFDKKEMDSHGFVIVDSTLKCSDFPRHCSQSVDFNHDIFLQQMHDFKKIVWISNIKNHDASLRCQSAIACGLMSRVLAPIMIGENVVGALEFFAIAEYPENTELSTVLQNIGVQIGRAIERYKYEASLLAARKIAEESMQARSEFLSNMSHELRTPMHAILNYASMGMKYAEIDTTGKLNKYLCNIQISGQRLLALLNNLLDLAKLESGKMMINMEKNNLFDVISHVKMELDSLLTAKNIKLIGINNSPDALVLFDKHRIIQVLINLVSNAIKFSAENKTIEITIDDYGFEGQSFIICSVKDEGIGIAQSELESVFDKFVQGSKTKSGAGGTGLGLSICREIIQAHGGKIWAASNDGQGCTFSFILPVGF